MEDGANGVTGQIVNQLHPEMTLKTFAIEHVIVIIQLHNVEGALVKESTLITKIVIDMMIVWRFGVHGIIGLLALSTTANVLFLRN